mgnify:CR=1 FL=1
MRIVLMSFLLSFCFFVQGQDTTVQKKDIISSTKLFDLNFTTKEIDTLYSDVIDNIANYKAMHQLNLPNSVPLSLWQTPVVAGMHFNKLQKNITWKLDNTVSLPNNKNDLAFYSIEQLASLIKNKKISSLALTQFVIDRIKKWGDTLQCVISLQEDIAYAQAKKADAELAAGKYRGLLHGIPYGLKDLFAVKGTKTTWGAAPYQNQIIDEDAYVYTKLKEAGAVLVAKFTLGALAMGDYWFGGRTKNPWNLKYGSSGSSAGSASATVAGLVPFAIGTETWGSIVSPSTTCGATGLRPTFGSVSRTGAMALSYSLDKIGPICRSAADAAIVFNYIHGTDGKDGSAVNMPFNYSPQKDIHQLKIAYAKNYYDKIEVGFFNYLFDKIYQINNMIHICLIGDTNIDIYPQKLYKLIWTNTVESCMANSTGITITASLTAPKNNEYKYTTELIEFPGWKIVDGYEKENPNYNYLQNIKKNCIIPYNKIKATVTMNELKSHYTEANLIKILEFFKKQ